MAELRKKVINEPISNLTELQLIADALADDGILVNVIGLGFYKLDKSSTVVADEFLVVTTNSGTGRWLNISNWQGTPTTTVGGIPSGVAVPNTPIPLLIDKMLRPYINPTFTAFSIVGVSVLEVGDKITGNKDFTWTIQNIANVQPNTVEIKDVTNNIVLLALQPLTPPATFDFTNYAGGGLGYNIATGNSFSITALNTLGSPFSYPYTVNWRWRKFWGNNPNAVLTEAMIEALTSSALSNTGLGTYSFAAADQEYKHIAVASVLPQPTVFTDQLTGQNVAMDPPYTVSVTNPYGVATNYSVYKTTNKLGGAITIIAS